MILDVINAGRMDYLKALTLQEKLLAMRQQGEICDTLILVEHPPVITVGINGNESNIIAGRDILERQGVKIYNVNRGGDVTYHGPGQIVGYPVIDLKHIGKGVKDFIYALEEVFIRLLENEFDIKAEREEGRYTGVWVKGNKITAIGVAVKRWVTMHGFAFNVNTDLEDFKWITPCGITDKGVTSLEKLTGEKQDFSRLCTLTEKYFCKVFDFEVKNGTKKT